MMLSVNGISLSSADDNTITGNNVNNLHSDFVECVGISLSSSNYTVVTGNNVNTISSRDSSATGITLSNSNYTTIIGNNVNTINGTSAYCFVLSSSGYNTISDNVIGNTLEYGTFGIGIYGFITSNDYNVIIGNIIYNCDTGISVTGIGNEVYYNIGA